MTPFLGNIAYILREITFCKKVRSRQNYTAMLLKLSSMAREKLTSLYLHMENKAMEWRLY